MLFLGLALFLSALVLSLIGTHLARRWAGRMGMMDPPGARKVHAAPTPRNGGIAIFWSLALPLLVGLFAANWLTQGPLAAWLPAGTPAYVPGVIAHRPLALLLLICTLGIHLLGLRDDRRPLSAGGKLFGQLLMAVALVAGGEWIQPGGFRIMTFLDHLVPGGVWLSGAASVLWIVLLTNAFNFMDNMDGLSAGVAGICAAMFFLAALLTHQWFICGLLLLYLGAVGGFLAYNFPPASIFMGDGGSMVLGFFLAALTIRTTYYSGNGRWYDLFVPLVVTAVPIYDLLVVSWVRLRRGRSPMVGDTNHFSHRLVRHGFSPRGAVLVIYAITLACGLSAPLLARVGTLGALLIAVQVLSILTVVGILERVGEHTR